MKWQVNVCACLLVEFSTVYDVIERPLKRTYKHTPVIQPKVVAHKIVFKGDEVKQLGLDRR